MQNKSYKYQENTSATIDECVADCETAEFQKLSSDRWNPNVPLVGTPEEWWEHFHQLENSKFFPVSEVHQQIAQWLDNQRP